MNIKEQYIKYCEIYQSNIKFNDFKKVLSSLNLSMFDELIKGKSFNMGFKLGSVHVVQKERRIKYSELNGTYYTTVNWPESKKNKKKLIESGKLPLEYIKENNKIIGNNGGEKWMVFNTSVNVYKIYWNRYRVTKDKFKEGFYFPLERIRNYHIKITRPLYQKLYKVAIENNINYNNISIT
jgi:hypothetical protein